MYAWQCNALVLSDAAHLEVKEDEEAIIGGAYVRNYATLYILTHQPMTRVSKRATRASGIKPIGRPLTRPWSLGHAYLLR